MNKLNFTVKMKEKASGNHSNNLKQVITITKQAKRVITIKQLHIKIYI